MQHLGMNKPERFLLHSQPKVGERPREGGSLKGMRRPKVGGRPERALGAEEKVKKEERKIAMKTGQHPFKHRA